MPDFTPQPVKVYGSLVLAELICGGWPVVASWAIRGGFDPIVFCLYRCIGGTLLLSFAASALEGHSPLDVLGPALALKSDKGAEVARRFPWKSFLILAALMATEMLSYITGVALTTSTLTALAQTVHPMVTSLIGLVLGTESINGLKCSGILLCVAGAMYAVYAGHQEAQAEGRPGHLYQFGVLALLIQVVAASFFVVKQKVLLQSYSPIFISSMTWLINTCYIAVVAFGYIARAHRPGEVIWDPQVSFLTWQPWMLTHRRSAALAYAVILTTAFNYSAKAWANKITTPSTVTVFRTLQPLAAAFIVFICFGTAPHAYTLVGGAAILCGLLLFVKGQLADFSAHSEGTDSGITEETRLI